MLTPVAFLTFPFAIMAVNSRSIFFATCVIIFVFSGFTDQAYGPIKIMFVIPIMIDFTLGAN